MISKSDESAAQIPFEIISMVSDQNCTTRNSVVNSNSKLFLTAGRVRKKKTKKESENKMVNYICTIHGCYGLVHLKGTIVKDVVFHNGFFFQRKTVASEQ